MRFLVCLILLVSCATSAMCDERTEALDKQSYEMYQQVFSPFCPGRSLNDCPSSKAHELKAEMRTKLEQGVPEQEILNEVFARFGDKYRAVPLFEGFGRMVWLAPLAFLTLGFVIALGVVLRRKKTVSTLRRSPESVLSAEMEREIESELSKLD